MLKVRCPICGGQMKAIGDHLSTPNAVWRTRHCGDCGSILLSVGAGSPGEVVVTLSAGIEFNNVPPPDQPITWAREKTDQ